MRTFDEQALLKLLKLLQKKPCGLYTLSSHFDKSPRTINRWLNELKCRGHRVMRDGIGVQAPFVIIP